MKLHRDLGVTQKTAWHLAQKIRQGWLDGQDDGEKLQGVVEVDETYIGGISKNMHAKDRRERKQYRKETVVGMLERDGDIRVAHIHKQDAPALVREHVCHDNSVVMTDAAMVYRDLGFDYEHYFVNHSVGEYVRGQAHTNGIESFWAMLKRGYMGTYHKMSAKHLSRYIVEFAGRHNVRDFDTIVQMEMLAKGFVGKRLRYKDLVS
jgi:hypothetical protein